MRQGGVLTYLHGDHLGSASLATNASGAQVLNSEQRYLPYGGTHPGFTGSGLPTDRQYTGQRREASLGFYDYVARQFDPALGRFLQADSIIPNPANPQSLNRYSYTLGNPLRYTDPSGHFEDDAIKEYLKQLYGEDGWWSVWESWLADETWISMLREAQAGDIVAFYNQSGNLALAKFYGVGRTQLASARTMSALDSTDFGNQIHLGKMQQAWSAAGIFRLENGHYTAPWGSAIAYAMNADDVKAYTGAIKLGIGVAGWDAIEVMAVLLMATDAFDLIPYDKIVGAAGIKEGNDKLFLSLRINQGESCYTSYQYEWIAENGRIVYSSASAWNVTDWYSQKYRNTRRPF